ncbi:MAG: class I SAM-dependent methyltransferase [Candidatus Pacebacteria bacterium]|nr:class I SAM-dependent methyltransferase [Candidatus Paceibacterota bacterium]
MDKKYAQYILNKTKDDYNLIADDFSRTRDDIWDELMFLFEDVKEGEKMLDLGCGNGRFYKVFKEKNADYIGVDNSEKLIEIAKKRYPEADFQTADSLNLPFPNSYFNRIYAIALFHHIPSKKLRLLFLKEAKRVLKEKGVLILTVWKFYRLKDYLRIIRYAFLKIIRRSKLDFKDIFEPWGNKTNRYYHWFSKREVEGLLKQSGFEIKEVGIVRNKRGNRKNIYLICEK